MTLDELKKVPLGLYQIAWKNDRQRSLAAVGNSEDGRRWIAPTNWLAAINPDDTYYEKYVELIETLIPIAQD